MEYIIGESTFNRKPILQLKTIGDEHTDLSGKVSFVKELSGSRIEYSCEIKEHYSSTEDAEGKCYDFYIVEDVCVSENLSDAAEERFNSRIAEYAEEAGMMVEQIYQSDCEYIIGE